MSYVSKIHGDGPDLQIVESGGRIKIMSGGAINYETQASHIADVAGGATVDAESRTAVNAILAALRNVGLIASS